MGGAADFIAEFNAGRNFRGEVLFEEPLSAHTTFRVGGPAEVFLRPAFDEVDAFAAYAAALVPEARARGFRVFFLGGGANIVVADAGLRGIVLDMSAFKNTFTTNHTNETNHTNILAFENSVRGVSSVGEVRGLKFLAGTKVDDAVECAAAQGLSGLEFLAGMPGTIGGALWMNARCYGKSVSDIFASADIIDFGFKPPKVATIAGTAGFDYKQSPFQQKDCLILGGSFSFIRKEKEIIFAEMAQNRDDRRKKGHYDYPSAGSAFKNNREFGKPTGKIIDELGLKEFSVGGAEVFSRHGNIIINKNKAKAAEIAELSNKIKKIVLAKTGFSLESEILFIS